MLVLTRKRDEMISIGSDIVIRVIRTGKGSVRLGIEAPASIRVLRGELATPFVAEAVCELDADDSEEAAEDEEVQFEQCDLDALLVQN